MKRYIEQLLEDIEEAILLQWVKNTPHFFTVGLVGSYLKEPIGLQGFKEKNKIKNELFSEEELEHIASENLDKSIMEVESYIEEGSSFNMYYYFGFQAVQFPPVESIPDDQIDLLVDAMLRLWAIHNYSVIFPANAPSKLLYSLMTDYMNELTILCEFGNLSIEFCQYDPNDCPFGIHCTCIDDYEDD